MDHRSDGLLAPEWLQSLPICRNHFYASTGSSKGVSPLT